MPAIETEDLTRTYGRSRGIRGLDLVVPTGAVFGFLGPNGAGKTTTIRVLLDFLRPSSGTARVLGLDSRADSVAIRRRVGYVPGEIGLYERITGRELLDWFGRLRGGVDQRVVGALVDRFQVELDRPVHTLSKGNKQKLALVQAFVHEPELLLLDEPTAGLDPIVQHEFQLLVREVADSGATVFLSSHVLDEVQHLCDQVGIIRDGRLVDVESVAALRDRAVREVTIRFDGTFDPATDVARFAALPGVRDVSVRDHSVHLHLVGEADALVKLAATHRVVEFSSAPPDLDDLFLHFYVDDDGHEGDDR
ncbi:MAG: ABC transporter ATP-binding protein [Acidimicrobiia bacterium]